MIQRIRQFIRAINAKITSEDIEFVNKFLNDQEKKLFFSMQVFDQRHVLNVAYTAKRFIQEQEVKVDEFLLMRACLLHDVGRNAKDICLADKVINVLVSKLLPKQSLKWAKNAQPLGKLKYKSFWQKRRYALYIYFYHAQIGAELLQRMGLYEIAEIIREHHNCLTENACVELQILCKADSLN